MLPKHRSNLSRIPQIPLYQSTPLDIVPVAGAQIIENHRLMTGRSQCFAGMGTDIAGSAGDENHDQT
jgi:hypothetical protein